MCRFLPTLLFSVACASLYGQQWQEITQPIGTLERLWGTTGTPPLPLQPPSRIPPFSAPTTPVEEVNYICAQWDVNITPATVPFSLNTSVTEIVLTRPQHFVRVYAPSAGSGPNGVWMMRSEYVRGLTPEQIQDRFALPELPTHIVNVDLPASPDPTSGKEYALWTGVSAPITGFGAGGGVQNRVISDFNGTNYFPNYTFFIGTRDHQQEIGLLALSYQPMAGGGERKEIAKYLDGYIPVAYSDLEHVYTALDYLNWVGYGPKPIQKALIQIGPQNYSAIPFVIGHNALLFSNALLDRCYTASECCEAECPEPEFSVQALGQYMQKDGSSDESGFDDWSGGVMGTWTCPLASNWVVGASLAGIDNGLHWHQGRGSAQIRTVKLGLYSHYTLCDCFIDGLFTVGYDWVKASRAIKFFGIDRHAHSKQNGYDVALHGQFGYTMRMCQWQMTPLARLSYFYVRENGFHEHGAKSLNLKVKGFDEQAVRTQLGIAINRSYDWCHAKLLPQIYVAWIYGTAWKQGIKSRLRDVEDYFTTSKSHENYNGFLCEASLCAELSDTMAFEAVYEVEMERKFCSQSGRLNLNVTF